MLKALFLGTAQFGEHKQYLGERCPFRKTPLVATGQLFLVCFIRNEPNVLNVLNKYDMFSKKLYHISSSGFQDEFRSAIEVRFNIKITDDAWQQFVTSGDVKLTKPPGNANQGQKGYVPYNDFLTKFDVMLR